MKVSRLLRDKSGRFIKGSGGYWTGQKLSYEHRQKLSESHIGQKISQEHPLWVGEDVSYPALHSWVRRHLGTPQYCEHCGSTDKSHYEWANKSGNYKRDLDDWLRLCKSCHHRYDSISTKAWITRRANHAS